jgi:hypothetical protein
MREETVLQLERMNAVVANDASNTHQDN